MRIRLFAGLMLACLMSSAPIHAQDVKISALPAASALGGTEKLSGVQGAGCATSTAPCANKAITPAQIATYVAASTPITSAFQPLDSDLTAIAALTTTSTGRSLLAAADAAAIRTIAGAVIGTNVQAWDADLDALAAMSTPATTLAGAAQKASNLSDLASASTARTNLGVTATGSDTTYAYRANNLSDVASASTARTNLGLAIGTNVQAYSADLAAVAGLSPSNDDVLQRKSGAWTNRTLAQLRQDLVVPIVSMSAVSVSHTGDTTETALATVPIAANAIGPNGCVEVSFAGLVTNSANTKTFRVKLGTTAFFSPPLTATASFQAQTTICNRNSAAVQVGGVLGTTTIVGSSSSALSTGTVDTTSSQNLTITGQLTNTGESISVERYIVRVIYGA